MESASGETTVHEGSDLVKSRPSAVVSVAAKLGVRKRSADPLKAAERRLRDAERTHKKSQRRETKRFTHAVRKVRLRVYIASAAVGALVLFVALGAFTPLMSVRDVQVEGAQSVNVEEVSQSLQRFEGVPLALVDENDVLRALEGFPLIQRFAVERVPPHTLLVRIEERVPAIALEEKGVYRQYDAAGVLVAEGAELPVGVPLGEGSLRATSSPAFHAASKIVRDLPTDIRSQLVSAKATSTQDVTFVMSSGVEVFWGSAEETRRKALVLTTLLSSLEGRAVSHIDVSSSSAPIFK
ncbi:MAG: FtsQ-type POTRA domain-containing protein [Leucobacter sp.]